MIQYNNFLMKREQSRAGSRFAECEKSRLKAKILITLALLLTAVTGAWAADTYTITFSGFGNEACNKTVTDATLEYSETFYVADVYANYIMLGGVGGSNDYVSISKSQDETQITITVKSAFEGTVNVTVYYMNENWDESERNISVTCVKSAPAITVEPVEGKTNEWTFSMPGSDVVLTPQYAPAAQLDENGAPAAVSGLEIAADAAIITAGQSAQGTLLYAVGTSETEKPVLTAFAATLPNAKDQTAAGTYYVWYYIQGQDTPQGEEPTADNTFNDSEIMGPVTVELLTNEHTLNIKQSPNITVTVAGTAKTPTDDKVTPVTTGQEVKIKANTGYKFRKVEVKKGAPDVKITSFSIHTSSNYVYSAGTFTCSIIDILPANATNQTFEWNINSGAPVGTAIKTVSDDTKTVTILAGAVSGSITIEATAKDGGGANKVTHIMVME